MDENGGPGRASFFTWLFGHGVMKRTILAPMSILLAVAFALSWSLNVWGSRAAVLHAADSLALSTAKRAVAELHQQLSSPAAIVEANSAFVATARGAATGSYADTLPGIFAAQLESYRAIDLISVGFTDGEYAEAQRVSENAVRFGRAGAGTGGALSLYHIGRNGLAVEEVRKEGYDPRLRPWFKAALKKRKLYWTVPYAYFSSGEHAIAVVKAISKASGQVLGVAQASVRLSEFSRFMASMDELEGGFAALLAKNGSVLAAAGAIPDVAAFSGAAMDASAAEGPVVRREVFGNRSFRVVSLPDVQAHYPDWRLAVAVPEDRFIAPLRRKDAGLAALYVASFLIVFCLAFLIATNLSEPLHQLSLVAADLDSMSFSPEAEAERQRTLHKISQRSDEIGRLAAAFEGLDANLAEAFSSLRSSLKEKEVLLREVHHRVKNNLQIVSSLLSLRAGDSEDPVLSSHFEEIRDRVHAMSLVHETIYSSGEFAAVPMDDYLLRVVRSLSALDKMEASVSLDVNAEGVRLPLEKAIPCALVVVELTTNAFKHAFAGRSRGTVLVSLVEKEGSIVLSVVDDGAGLKESGAPGGMGKMIVGALAAQLGGTVDTETGRGGTRVTLRFDSPR